MLEQLDWQSWYTALVIISLIVALVHGGTKPYLLFLVALSALIAPGIVNPLQAISGFFSGTVLTVAALFLVAAGVQHTRLLSFLEQYLTPRQAGIRSTLFRIMGSTSVMSSFLNNTPIVAMLTPQLQQWSERIGIPVSRLLIPLSYAAIVGGTITVIGTSTNIIVSEMLSDRGYAPFHLFQLVWIGLPATVLVVIWFVVVGYRFLPDRPGPGAVGVVGKISAMPDTALVKNGTGDISAGKPHTGRIPVVDEQRVYHGGLAFAGSSGTVNPPSGVYATRHMAAGVYAARHTASGIYSARYTAAGVPPVVASNRPSGVYFARNGGDAGDGAGAGIGTGTGNGAGTKYGESAGKGAEAGIGAGEGNGDDTNEAGRKRIKKWPSIGVMAILMLMIGSSAFGVMPVHWAVISAAAAMVATGILPVRKIGPAVHYPVLVVIGAALGIGSALEQTGLAEILAHTVIQQTSGYGIVVVLIGIYLMTNLLTEMVTNNAAAVLMVPVALSASLALGIDPHAVAITVAVAASASFLTPIGYQTNLMVMEPGGYRFTDYMKAGFPVTLILMTVTISVVTWLWV